ncbi:MAG: glycosyltransferase [Salinivirgaceae bacterium]|nr:glycosyltransferase [Salinivirgaceae bacterium]
MKILEIISNLGNGGAEKLVVELSNELTKTNKVTLVSFTNIEEWMFFPKNINRYVNFIQLSKKKGFDVKLFRVLFLLLKNEKPDVVHIHLQSTLRYFLFLIPFFKKVQFVYTIHHALLPAKQSFKKFSKLWFFKKIKFVCLTNTIKQNFIECFPNLNFLTINNGVNHLVASLESSQIKEELKQYSVDNMSKIFLYVGRLSSTKNIPLLLNVFGEFSDKNIKLIIIGEDGSEDQENYKLVNNTSNKNIIYLGPKENIADYMYLSDALILTSRHEGMPIVVLEALSVGLPIISTPAGGMVDLVRNKVNGFLSADITKESMVRAIKLFLELSIEEKDKISESNRVLFKSKYSIENCAREYAKVFYNEYE